VRDKPTFSLAILVAWLPSGSARAHSLQGGMALLLLAVLVGLVSRTTSGLSASPDDVITVCQAGPPACDYQAIQEGIDAAVEGDTVLVGPGIYTGQLTLKDQVALESSDGPAVTIIRATQGPIVTASGVVSAILRGLSISGQAVVTTAVGINLYDSELSLFNCVVRDLRGPDGRAAGPDGGPATAIRSWGTGKLTVSGSVIQDIHGGHGLGEVEGGAIGGYAVGISVSGTAQLTVTATVIHHLSGGHAGGFVYWPYGCDGTGGRATAIHTSGEVDLVVNNSQITNLVGGEPCSAWARQCVERAGAVIGVQASGGTVELRDNLFADLGARAGRGSEPNYAIHTSLTDGTYLERNTIASLSASDGYAARELRAAEPQSPYCTPPPGTIVAIGSESDSWLVAVDNSLSNLLGTGRDGQAVGILARGVADVELSRNTVIGIVGGSAGLTASGFRLEQVNAAQVNANVLGGIRGADALPHLYFLDPGLDGGSAAGIELTGVSTGVIVNNVIRALSGGRGNDCEEFIACTQGRNGGDATALLVQGSPTSIVNNSCYQTVAGAGGEPDGEPGSAVGLRLAGWGEVTAANNALVQHGIGVLSTPPVTPLLEHNDLWENERDYAGLAPGASDLYVDPAFVDADLHVGPDSPLIDAGTNSGIPPEDADGEPRPLDGDDDGVAIADIGADEYWPGLRGSTKTVDKGAATAGDVLTYRLTLVNPSSWFDLPGVQVADPIPDHMTYVPGSLWASSGSPTYADGVVRWTGTALAGLPVTVTFRVTVDQVGGPQAIVNRAVVDDQVGLTCTLQATTLIDPLRYYLPVVFALFGSGGSGRRGQLLSP
jgi:uncharacterized repeat protein (TIGR01451 family)